MIVVGLTGGIASGKTTIVKLLKKKGLPIHDSDAVVKSIYSKSSAVFISYLKTIGLKRALKKNKINKAIIREEIFNSVKKRKKLEKYIHNEVKKSRDRFLKINKSKKRKIIFLDIPLLFENNLENICHYTILFYAPTKLRKRRAIQRSGMNKTVLKKIIESQLTDSIKKRKADFVINTSISQNRSLKAILSIINSIKNMKNA